MKEKFKEAIIFGIGSAIGASIVSLIMYYVLKKQQEAQMTEIARLQQEIQYHY